MADFVYLKAKSSAGIDFLKRHGNRFENKGFSDEPYPHTTIKSGLWMKAYNVSCGHFWVNCNDDDNFAIYENETDFNPMMF